jgi:CHAT domain-containing protein/tetratricopeptide (TPR) repeat protein
VRVPRLQLALSFLVAGSALGMGWFLLRESFFASPARLIQKAYSEQRTVELRLGKAPHSALRVQRGPQATRMERPASLLEAEAAIARGLRNHPEDPALLAARGQANLLEWAYEAAITDMQEALDTQPKSAAVLNGLASAYFERAEAEDRFEDYGTAFELQSRALQHSHDDPVLLFNRAITGSRLFLFKQSIEDFERYLGIDSSSEWADEAKQRLNEVKGIVEAHDRRTKAPLLTPAEFVQQVDPAKPETWEKVEPRIEEYLSLAITDWLPAAFPATEVTPASGPAKQASAALAGILKERHSDTWLSELLSATESPSFADAVAALRSAVRADNADYALGRREANRAARLFDLAGNSAGELRARFEEVYAARLSDAGPECVSKLSRFTPSIEHSGYRRLLIQARLESYNCSGEEGDFNHLDQLDRASHEAHSASYPSIELRLLSTIAVDDLFKGKRRSGLNRCQFGLREYWSSSSTNYLGRTLYAAASYSYEREEKWHLARATRDELISIASPTQDPLSLAIEHTDLARASLMSAEPAEASTELNSAQKLFSSVAQTPATANYRITEETSAALVDAESGKPEDGLARMERTRPQLSNIANINVVAEFYRVEGELQVLAGRLSSGEEELAKAVALGEKVRGSVHSEPEQISWMRGWSRPYLDLVEVKLKRGDTSGALAIWELYRDFRVDRSSIASNSPSSPESDLESAVTSTQLLIQGESGAWKQAFSRLADETVLVLALTPHGIATWTYDNRGINAQWIQRDPADTRLEVQRLAELCAQPSSSLGAFQALARNLHERLIGPILDKLRQNQTLVIQADDILSLVPFQVLIGRTGKYLEDEHPVVYLSQPSFDGTAASNAERFTARSRAFVVASPGGSGNGLRPLSDVLAEARAVLRYFPQGELLPENQTSIGVVSHKISEAEIFHFAGHASMQSRGNALVFGSDDSGEELFLASALHDISAPQLRLVVLSACSTENGEEGSPEDLGSFARVLLAKGIPHVVATRWNVDSTSTVSLMELFYERLLAGASVPQALASAEAALRQKTPHPYYWAAFDAFGKN